MTLSIRWSSESAAKKEQTFAFINEREKGLIEFERQKRQA